jgi:hypothetical protein
MVAVSSTILELLLSTLLVVAVVVSTLCTRIWRESSRTVTILAWANTLAFGFAPWVVWINRDGTLPREYSDVLVGAYLGVALFCAGVIATAASAARWSRGGAIGGSDAFLIVIARGATAGPLLVLAVYAASSAIKIAVMFVYGTTLGVERTEVQLPYAIIITDQLSRFFSLGCAVWAGRRLFSQFEWHEKWVARLIAGSSFFFAFGDGRRALFEVCILLALRH